MIMDFGLAKLSNINSNAFATQAGTILGSPAYMLPSRPLATSRTSTSVATFMHGNHPFELLTGELPFSGTTMQILGQKSILDPTSPLFLKPDLPPQVATLCHKMIARIVLTATRLSRKLSMISRRRTRTALYPSPHP